MKKIALFFLLLINFTTTLIAQTAADVYKKPLSEVIEQVKKDYQVQFLYNSKIVEDKMVTYASWRFRASFKETMENILNPFELYCYKDKENIYIIDTRNFYERSKEEGARHLKRLSTLYNSAVSFEKRKSELRSCMLNALGINMDKERTHLNPIYRSKRMMNGYTVENVAFESFPGFYITGSLYRPVNAAKKSPAIACPHGHFPDFRADDINMQGRYRPDMQYRCAALAKMGAVVFDYSMYAYAGEPLLQTLDTTMHKTPFAHAIQTWNSIRVIDFLTSLPDVDTTKIGVTGASGGGSQTIFLAALDKRITASVPVVMVSSCMYGGCTCESGLPIHECGKYKTNNVEIAAMAAPNPQLFISDGSDWTKNFPTIDFPFVQKIYGLYGKKDKVFSKHLPNDQHNYGYTKRVPVYQFFANTFGLNIKAITNKKGIIDESSITIEPAEAQMIFNTDFPLPANALIGQQAIVKAFKEYQGLTATYIYY